MGRWGLSTIKPQIILCCKETFHQSRMQVISIQNKARSNNKNGSKQVCNAIVRPAGTWKMEEMSIMVFPPKMIVDRPDHMENGDDFSAYVYKFSDKDILMENGDDFSAYVYNFSDKDILIGDGSSLPAAELKRAVDELPAAPPSNPSPEASTSFVKEFHSQSGSHRDGIERKSMENDVGDGVHEIQGQGFHLGNNLAGFRAPLTRFSGVMAFAALILNLYPNVKISSLSKEMLLAGAAGFLMSKVAMVLASNKPF